MLHERASVVIVLILFIALGFSWLFYQWYTHQVHTFVPHLITSCPYYSFCEITICNFYLLSLSILLILVTSYRTIIPFPFYQHSLIDLIIQQVMRASYIEATLLVAASVVAAAAGLCHPGRTYWSPEKDTCLDCTRCEPLVVLRPCEVHRDTVCASLQELGLDWSWLGSQRQPKHHRKVIWRFESVSGEQTASSTTTEIPAEDYLSDNDDNEDDDQENVEVTIDNAGAETDWQTIVLTMASLAGVLFFVVVSACSCYYARQWRTLKDNMEAGKIQLQFTYLSWDGKTISAFEHTLQGGRFEV